MKRLLLRLGLVITLLFLFLYISPYDYLLKGVNTIYLTGHTTAYLTDYQRFHNDTVYAADQPQAWPLHRDYNRYSLNPELESYHKDRKSVAYLVIKNDSILYEKYYDGFGANSKSNSFSMVKSIISALMGIAIQEGSIKSLDQKVIDFIPELQGTYAQEVTMGDLSSMASGMQWDEKYYNPFSVTAASYFISDLSQLILDQPIVDEPGKSFRYLSGATQLLGIVISRATQKKLSDYLSKSFWQPMGAEQDALWELDSEKNGMEKAYCCFATNARDFARFGKLYKNNGRWNNTQILDSTFIAKSIQPRFKASPEYGYGWWLETYKGHQIFMERGHLGQYVIVFPELNLITVRLGELKGERTEGNPYTEDIYIYMDAALEMAENVTKDKSS